MEDNNSATAPDYYRNWVTGFTSMFGSTTSRDLKIIFNTFITFSVLQNFSFIEKVVNDGFHCIFTDATFDYVLSSYLKCEHNGIRVAKSEWAEIASNSSDRQRIQLACATFIFLHERLPHQDLKKNFSLFWDSVKEPFLCSEELYKILLPSITDNWRSEFSDMCQIYKNLELPGSSSQDVSPRTLKHLSRCAVRDCIVDNVHIQEGINRLQNIPTSLLEYLKHRN